MQYALSSDRAAVAESDIALSVVFIKNASGDHSFCINGPFVCASHDILGHAVYSKLGDCSVCIELFANHWHIIDVNHIGIDSSLAKVNVNPNSSLLEDCISEKWTVLDNQLKAVQPGVKMLTGADARREVSSLCMIAFQPCHLFPSHIYPLLSPCVIRIYSAQAAEYATSIGRAVAEDNARAAPVLISGAAGWQSEGINGFFAPTQERGLDGRVVYSKCGCNDTVIIHRNGRWAIKAISSKFWDHSAANVLGGCCLEECGSRPWTVYTHKEGRVPQTLNIETGPEVERKVSNRRKHALHSSHVHPLKHLIVPLPLMFFL
jgi:hypothetical protein